jgi:hypothetical protein
MILEMLLQCITDRIMKPTVPVVAKEKKSRNVIPMNNTDEHVEAAAQAPFCSRSTPQLK